MMKIRRSVYAAAVAAIAFAAGAAASAVASLAQPPDSTNVGFISIPAHRLLTNVSIASRHSSSPVVIGGATTVPTDATTVRLAITANSATSGTIAIYPAGNPGTDDQFVQYPKGVTITRTPRAHPGTANEITLTNTGPSPVTVTVSVVGYSTLVNAASVSGQGGAVGQVLTNNVSGAEWRTMGAAYSAPDTGLVELPPGGYSAAVKLAVPADSYEVQVTAELESTPSQLSCFLDSPSGDTIATLPASTTELNSVAQVTTGALLTTPGGALSFYCRNIGTSAADFDTREFAAIQVGSVN